MKGGANDDCRHFSRDLDKEHCYDLVGRNGCPSAGGISHSERKALSGTFKYYALAAATCASVGSARAFHAARALSVRRDMS